MLGQIGCDSNGKLNAKSVVLEGDREHSSGGQIPLNLSELKEYSLFPGQVRPRRFWGVWGGVYEPQTSPNWSLTPFSPPPSDRGAGGDQQHREDDGGLEALRGDGVALPACPQQWVWDWVLG